MVTIFAPSKPLHKATGNIQLRVPQPTPGPKVYVPKTPTLILPGRQQAPNSNRIGSAVAMDKYNNCMTCQRWSVCKDPSKAFNYRCDRWQELAVIDESFYSNGIETVEDAVKNNFELRGSEDPDVIIDRIKAREQEQSISDILNHALDSGFSVPPDLRIDDRDLRAPANYFEWVRGSTFSGMKGDLFPMQHKIMVEYHGEYCPRCTDMNFLESMRVNSKIGEFEDRVQLLRFGKCPRCNVTKAELVESGELNEYYVLNGVAGQRGGKTAVINVSEGYQTARWLKIPNPQRVFNLLDQQVIVATYCALTFAQVRRNLWDPFQQSLGKSPWFQAYHKMLDHYGEKFGEELYAFKDIFITYRHRGMQLVPSGPNKRTMRGATRYSAVIDELGWFPFGEDNEEKEKMSAEEIFEALENSLATLQNKHEKLLAAGNHNLPKPLMSNISSPKELNDMIMTLHKKSIGSDTSYTFKLPTWDMNPEYSRESKFIKRKFAQNEQKAMRDFGCEPPLSSMSWITEIKNALGVFNHHKNNVIVRQHRFNSRSGQRQTSGIAEIRMRSNGGRVLALDAGYVNNSFAFAVVKMQDGIPIVESMGEVFPDHKAPISFPALRDECLLPIVQGCGVQFIVADRWNSTQMLQEIEDETGAAWYHIQAKYPDFENLRERIYDETILLPKLEIKADDILTQQDEYPSGFMRKPVAHLLYQMFTVRDFVGKTVEKGSGATDDLFRSVVLGLAALQIPEIVDNLNDDGNQRPAMFWGVSASLGSSGGKSTTNIGAQGARATFGGAGSQAGSGTSKAAGVSVSRK